MLIIFIVIVENFYIKNCFKKFPFNNILCYNKSVFCKCCVFYETTKKVKPERKAKTAK